MRLGQQQQRGIGLLLAAIAALLWRARTQPHTATQEEASHQHPGILSAHMPPPVAVPVEQSHLDCWQVMHKGRDGNWEPTTRWVVKGMGTWEDLFDTPGCALRSKDGAIEEGRQ